jgi:hypothetical protein
MISPVRIRAQHAGHRRTQRARAVSSRIQVYNRRILRNAQANLVGFRADYRRGNEADIQEPQRGMVTTTLPTQERNGIQPAFYSTPCLPGGRPDDSPDNGSDGCNHSNRQNGELTTVRVRNVGVGTVISQPTIATAWYLVRLLNTVTPMVVGCTREQLTACEYESTWKVPYLSEVRTTVSYIRVKVG